MKNSAIGAMRALSRIAAVALLAFPGTSVNADGFKVSKVAWRGDALHIEIRTDLPDGTELNVGISNEKTGNDLVCSPISATVSEGKLVVDGFETDMWTEKPLRAGGHYWLSIAEDARPLAFVAMPIAVPKRSKQPGKTRGEPPRTPTAEDEKSSPSPSPDFGFEVKPSWVDDVLRITGKTDLPDGTWLSFSLFDDQEVLAVDEFHMYARVRSGQFVLEGYTKDGLEPLSPGNYTLLITPRNAEAEEGKLILDSARKGEFGVRKTLIVKKRPKWTRSRLAEVKALNAVNMLSTKMNEPEAAPGDITPLADSIRVNDAIKTLTRQGSLRIDCGSGKAWVDPAMWQESDAAQKEQLARMIYEKCASESINIYDAQSAKKLARYGSVLGFRVY